MAAAERTKACSAAVFLLKRPAKVLNGRNFP